MEPYSEMYASKVGSVMGANMITYKLSKWKKNLCSVCELFTSEDISFVPVGRIVKTGGMKSVRTFYESLGEKYVKALNEMLVIDAIICNTDRHFGNFGFLVDSHTNEIVAPAPLFDHGNSLFNFAGEENWASEEALDAYIETLLPCVYEDFISAAKEVLDDELKEKVRKLLNFKVEKSGKYNYPQKKLSLLEKQIRKRARLLLD